jgi:phytoene synthase
METAEIDRIVRQSKSNLAVTLICLPRKARRDMQIFYAFCRIVDDIADEPGRTVEQKYAELARWSEVVQGNISEPQPMELAVVAMMQRHAVPAEEMQGIIEGVRQDVEPREFATWADLQKYCHGVASCVGLVSTRLFGCTEPASRDYAVQLGYALQLTNILRDVGADLAEHGRIYLPQETRAAHGVHDEALRAGKLTPEFLSLMREETKRARGLYAAALQNLTRADKHKLRAAETMRRIYTRVLDLMEADGYQVFTKRYRVSKLGKLYFLARAVIGGWMGR